MTRSKGILLAFALLSTLRTKAGVPFSSNDGWTIVKDSDGANWSFTPAHHYAHPSVGHRTIEEYQASYFVRTELICQATNRRPASGCIRTTSGSTSG